MVKPPASTAPHARTPAPLNKSNQIGYRTLVPSFYSRPVYERFRPVALPARADGWTVERQRGFVRAVGEGLSTAVAARRVGMSGRSADGLRARDGAKSFAKAWDTARALGRPVVEAWRPCRWRLHRWRGCVVLRERVWDERATWRLLARRDPYAAARNGAAVLSYTDGGPHGEQRGTFGPLTINVKRSIG